MSYENRRYPLDRNRRCNARNPSGDTITIDFRFRRSPATVSPSAASAASPLYQRPETWYEFLLKQFNPDDIDYGSWLEKRRQAFLEASVQNPYFKYSAGAPLALVLVTLLVVKQQVDHRRSMWVTAEMMTDLYNHDAYSRQVAREAIERYNDHIERCNRAIEASEHGVPAADSDNDRLTAELQSVTAERDSYRRERDLAKQELAEKERVLADMSLRLDALVKKADSGRNTLSHPQFMAPTKSWSTISTLFRNSCTPSAVKTDV